MPSDPSSRSLRPGAPVQYADCASPKAPESLELRGKGRESFPNRSGSCRDRGDAAGRGGTAGGAESTALSVRLACRFLTSPHLRSFLSCGCIFPFRHKASQLPQTGNWRREPRAQRLEERAWGRPTSQPVTRTYQALGTSQREVRSLPGGLLELVLEFPITPTFLPSRCCGEGKWRRG